MKKRQLLIKIFFIIILFISCSYCISYASETTPPEGEKSEETSEPTEVVGDDAQMLPTLGEGYRPTVTSGTKAIDIISRILGVMNVLGIISIVVAITLIGFGTILGSANEKAVTQEKYVGLLIAALLLTGGSALARMIMSVAEKIA